MGLELLDEVMAGSGVSRHAKYSAGILVQAVNRQRLQSAINRWQGLACDAALSRLQLAREEIGENAQRGELIVGCRHREQAGPLVHDRDGRIQVEQRNPRMNLPARPAVQCRGVAATQFDGFALADW